MFTIGLVTAGPQVEISSDYCSDNQIVYVRTSKTGDILFKDPVPRTANGGENHRQQSCPNNCTKGGG